jgi:hypothetical protein
MIFSLLRRAKHACSDMIHDIGETTEPKGYRVDTSIAGRETVLFPGGTTTRFRFGVPISTYTEDFRTSFQPVPLGLKTKIPKGRKVTRGRVTSFEQTVPKQTTNPRRRGNGTV